jgi:hypothetical protein
VSQPWRAGVSVAAVCLLALTAWPPLVARQHEPSRPADTPQPAAPPATALETAQRRFYDGRYLEAADLALALRSDAPGQLASYELRTSALLFQIKRLVGEAKDKEKAFKACETCPELLSLLLADVKTGQAAARATLAEAPENETARFYLGKLNLNYVWLHLGTLGRKTGWGEYREARRSLDEVLKDHPEHVRARVARGWIDYIVATKVPRGVRWLLGGGSKTRGLRAVREAAETEADFFTRAEARFALWDMQVRERDLPEAVVTARTLLRDFPENLELNEFLETHQHLALSLR